MAPRVLILYEYSAVGLPHGSAYIRLLQPLAHPSIKERFDVAFSPLYDGQGAEIVVVDRHWRPDCTPETARALLLDVRKNGAKLLYQIDDDLLALPANTPASAAKKEIVSLFLRGADGVIVSTRALQARYATRNEHVWVVANALDEQLLAQKKVVPTQDPSPLVLGYMGTFTHDDDLGMILPALRQVAQQVDSPLALQVIGAVAGANMWEQLQALPFPISRREPPVVEYPQFLPWFTANVHWDIGLAPLVDTPFNRAKSDIKFLDYAAAGVAGVYSDLPVYAESVRQGETGLLAANDTPSWVAALHTLIAQPSLRRDLARRAQEYLYEQRILAVRASTWADVLDTVLRDGER